MLVYWLTLGRAKSRMGGVRSLLLPSRASDIAVCQMEEGDAESRMNWIPQGSGPARNTGCATALRKGIERLQQPEESRWSES